MVVKNRAYAKFTSTIAGILILTSSGAYTSEPHSATQTLIEQTGVTTQIYSLSNLVAESSRTHAARCNLSPASDFVPGFNADSVIFDLVSVFRQNHRQSIEPVEIWYRSALAKKIKAAESEQIDITPLTDFLQSEHYKDPVRQKLISQIVDNVQASRFVAILGTEIEYAGIVHSGCIQHNQVEGKINSEQILANITREDKDLTAMLLRGEIIADTAYLYRNISIDDLQRYEVFTSSDTGSLFYSKLIDAVQESFKLAGDRLTKSINSEIQGSIDF